MKTNYLMLAQQYYTLIGEKNVEAIKSYLHPDVELYSPLATLSGKAGVIEATHRFMKTFSSLTIRTKLSAETQAMIVYNVDIPGIADNFPGASLLNFRDGLITRIDLFYDATRFAAKKEEIFSN